MIEIKNRFTGNVIHSGDFTSIKECLLDAIEKGVNLQGADLRVVDLRVVNLRGADLQGADLRDADLRGADLWGVNLRDADLRGVNLRDVNLRVVNLQGADLQGADLWWCAGNKAEIKSLWFSDAYPITYTSDVLQIGCERHSIADWWSFDDKRILEMDGKTALKFWRENKDLIKQIVEANPAKPTGKE